MIIQFIPCTLQKKKKKKKKKNNYTIMLYACPRFSHFLLFILNLGYYEKVVCVGLP